ncbi:MAG: PRC-barrel domain protein, partial [Eggerthellaceae bacterium]|nr:PRC-barrel domain protein [Eggerthellaceae bacterium]
AALMFHRKDLFVALDGFDIDDDNQIVVHDDPTATDKGARKALDLDWDKCVIWVGMPVMTASGDFIGYIDVVTFDRESGAIVRVSTENGAANDALLGKRIIPASYIKGFRRGQGIALAPMGEYNGEDPDEATETGAILVADRTLELPIEGGAAAAAGKATAVVTDKAKKGAAKAKVAVDEKVEQAKPVAKKVAEKTGEAVNEGAFVVGRQLGRTKGMFSAFKEEFDKASREDD